MALYIGKQKYCPIIKESKQPSIGGDEITCANETGKSLSEGDKVWINSASQVGGIDTKILDGDYLNPIVSSDGKYFYDVSLGIKIYQVVGNSVKFITQYD